MEPGRFVPETINQFIGRQINALIQNNKEAGLSYSSETEKTKGALKKLRQSKGAR
jgi:hypothetical protein